MLALFATALGALMILHINLQVDKLQDLAAYYDGRNRATAVQTIARNVSQYVREHRTAPADYDTLTDSAAYSHLRGRMQPWMGYARSQRLDDAVWRYRRWVVYAQDPFRGKRKNVYLQAAHNACGNDSFAASTDWCGAPESLWRRGEGRARYISEMANQRVRMNILLRRFSGYYSKHKHFPGEDATGTPLTPGNTYTLRQITGYSGSADNCGGIYAFDGLPVGCADLYAVWGEPVRLAYESPEAITLYAYTDFARADGSPVIVASELDYTDLY